MKWWEGDVCVVWLDPMQKLRVPDRAGPESLPQALALCPLLCQCPPWGIRHAVGTWGGREGSTPHRHTMAMIRNEGVVLL